MLTGCPSCGSEEVRLSRRSYFLRPFYSIFAIYMCKCETCDHHFKACIYRPENIFYAKCSRCHRMDLSRWSRDYYNPGLVTRMMLALGAKPVRCEYCRNNFWSFRMVREKFSKAKRSARSQIVIPVEDSASAVPESDSVHSRN